MAKRGSPNNSAKANKANKASTQKRVYLSQTAVPSYSLEDALRVPRAIADNFAYKPTKPLHVAKAMDMQPNSGGFRGLCGAAVAYGLTNGGPNAPEIAIEPLGMRIVRPLEEGDDLLARREALLIPRVVGDFLRKYDSATFPREDIAINVLIDMGVPQEKAEGVLSLILEGAESVGFIEEIKGRQYVALEGAASAPSGNNESVDTDQTEETKDSVGKADSKSADTQPSSRKESQSATGDDSTIPEANRRRVFIAHGKNKAFVEPIKKLLGFGELEAVVSVERQSVSQPVPDKVINEMRGCGAAIIHVDAELKLLDQEDKVHIVLNPNVLIEIGAAMALFGRRFILLVKDGIQLPTNLQGLLEVRYTGQNLDGEATIRLLEAINDIKNHPIPARYSSENVSHGAE